MSANTFNKLVGQRIATARTFRGISEACGVEWSDIYQVQDWVVVDITKARTDDGIDVPKNKFRYRTVPVALPFGSKLLEYKDEGYVWPNMPDYASKWWRELFETTLEGMTYIPLNRMRHTHETLLQRAGVVDSINARIHGRSNIQTGYRFYQDTAIAAMGAASDSLAGLLENNK